MHGSDRPVLADLSRSRHSRQPMSPIDPSRTIALLYRSHSTWTQGTFVSGVHSCAADTDLAFHSGLNAGRSGPRHGVRAAVQISESRSPDRLMPRSDVTLEPESVVASRKALAGTTIAPLNLFA